MSPVDITNVRFLFYGYSVAWLIVIGFVFLLVQRGRRIERELTRLKSLVGQVTEQPVTKPYSPPKL